MSATDLHILISFAAYFLGEYVGRKRAIFDRVTWTCKHSDPMCDRCSVEWGVR